MPTRPQGKEDLSVPRPAGASGKEPRRLRTWWITMESKSGRQSVAPFLAFDEAEARSRFEKDYDRYGVSIVRIDPDGPGMRAGIL